MVEKLTNSIITLEKKKTLIFSYYNIVFISIQFQRKPYKLIAGLDSHYRSTKPKMDKVEGSWPGLLLSPNILNAKSASELERPYLTICTARKGLMTSLFMGVVPSAQMSFPLAVLLLDRHFAKSPPFASISFFPAVYRE